MIDIAEYKFQAPISKLRYFVQMTLLFEQSVNGKMEKEIKPSSLCKVQDQNSQPANQKYEILSL